MRHIVHLIVTKDLDKGKKYLKNIIPFMHKPINAIENKEGMILDYIDGIEGIKGSCAYVTYRLTKPSKSSRGMHCNFLHIDETVNEELKKRIYVPILSKPKYDGIGLKNDFRTFEF